jgi:copper chaperone CopZ
LTVEQQQSGQRHHSRLQSLTRGRLRVKVDPEGRAPQLMESLQRRLHAREGIQEVRVNPATGSVTVDYDHARYSTAGILGVLEELDVIVDSTLGGEPAVSAGFPAAIDDLNARLHAATGLPVDLKLLMPLAFVGTGIWSIGKNGLMLESVPGWLLLWLAFDMFVKLHPGSPDARDAVPAAHWTDGARTAAPGAEGT